LLAFPPFLSIIPVSIFSALAQHVQVFKINCTDYFYSKIRYNSLESVLLKTVKNPTPPTQNQGFYINPKRLDNVDFLNFELFNPRFFEQVYKIFGLQAAYIYFPTLLVLFWFFCFVGLGFISQERSRIICLLLMLLCTGLLLAFGYY
jgi:hypothetical protein